MRKRPKGRPDPDVYALKVECLAELERLSERGHIDLYYGDESGVSLDPCVPYAWQFADEQVAMPTVKGATSAASPCSRASAAVRQTRLRGRSRACSWPSNWPAYRSTCRARRWWCWTTRRSTTARRSVNGEAVRQWRDAWQERGLFVIYLPPDSPELNIAEVLWCKL